MESQKRDLTPWKNFILPVLLVIGIGCAAVFSGLVPKASACDEVTPSVNAAPAAEVTTETPVILKGYGAVVSVSVAPVPDAEPVASAESVGLSEHGTDVFLEGGNSELSIDDDLDEPANANDPVVADAAAEDIGGGSSNEPAEEPGFFAQAGAKASEAWDNRPNFLKWNSEAGGSEK